MEFNSSYDQTNFMGYYPPSPISNGGWDYHQENTHSEHSNSWRFASEPQDEQENHMGYFLPPQNDASHDSTGGWEGNSNAPYDIHPKISSLDHASTESLYQNSPPTQTSLNQSHSKLETMFEKYEREAQIFWKRKENFFTNMEVHVAQLLSATKKVERQDGEAYVSSKILMKNEVEEALDPELLHSQEPLEVTMKHKDSLPEALMENHEGEREEDTQEKSNSSKAENHMKEVVMEPPIQKALDEDQTPKITQQPCLNNKEVKATNKSTNSVPKSASKLNQANFKRKLAERKPRKGTKAETSPPMKSFLLTNWKKRKKVKNNMSS
ncbi:hypothetical protein AHAS_Ahas02G0115600 [Arachis hypogaea]